MGLAQPKTYFYSFEEYLEAERTADERSEFIDGEIYADGWRARQAFRYLCESYSINRFATSRNGKSCSGEF